MRAPYGTMVIPQQPRIKESHCATDNLTGYPPRRARADAHCTAPLSLGLPPGIARAPAVCGWPQSDVYCGLPVLFSLQCVPHCASLSRWEAGRHGRHRRPAGGTRSDNFPAAVAEAFFGGAAQGPSTDLWLVPDAMELCHAGGATADETRAGGVRMDRAPLAP